jgi:hypothetical protein
VEKGVVIVKLQYLNICDGSGCVTWCNVAAGLPRIVHHLTEVIHHLRVHVTWRYFSVTILRLNLKFWAHRAHSAPSAPPISRSICLNIRNPLLGVYTIASTSHLSNYIWITWAILSTFFSESWAARPAYASSSTTWRVLRSLGGLKFLKRRLSAASLKGISCRKTISLKLAPKWWLVRYNINRSNLAHHSLV